MDAGSSSAKHESELRGILIAMTEKKHGIFRRMIQAIRAKIKGLIDKAFELGYDDDDIAMFEKRKAKRDEKAKKARENEKARE